MFLHPTACFLVLPVWANGAK